MQPERHGFYIANALDLGHDVTLVSVDPDFYLAVSPLTEAAYAHPNCQVIKSEKAFSIEELTALARELHAERPVHGVTTYSEYHTVHTAAVAEALGLPGMSVDGARNARHKHLTRLTLDGKGIRQPRFAHVSDPTKVEAAVREIGFPCVVKPSDGTASLHVLHLKDEDDLDAYLAELAEVVDYGRGVVRIPDILIEEFVTGELISVESCVLGEGEVVNLGLTDRPLSGFPHFIEMGATYFTGHPLQDELFEMTTKVLNELGVDFGFIHTEFLLGPDGPVLCEVNGRLHRRHRAEPDADQLRRRRLPGGHPPGARRAPRTALPRRDHRGRPLVRLPGQPARSSPSASTA